MPVPAGGSLAPSAPRVFLLRSSGTSVPTPELDRQLRDKGLLSGFNNQFEAISKPRIPRASASGYITNTSSNHIVLDRSSGLMWENMTHSRVYNIVPGSAPAYRTVERRQVRWLQRLAIADDRRSRIPLRDSADVSRVKKPRRITTRSGGRKDFYISIAFSAHWNTCGPRHGWRTTRMCTIQPRHISLARLTGLEP